MKIGDPRAKGGSGVWPLQGHNRRWDIDKRPAMLAYRLVDRQDSTDQLGHFVYEEGTAGDVNGGFFWPPATRSIGGWFFAAPAILGEKSRQTVSNVRAGSPVQGTDAPDLNSPHAAPLGNVPHPGGNKGSGTTPDKSSDGEVGEDTPTEGGSGEHCIILKEPGMFPVIGKEMKLDDRYASLPLRIPRDKDTDEALWPKFPLGTYGIALESSEEYEQIEYFFPNDPRLIAVNHSGDPECGSIVADLDHKARIDKGRLARLQSMMRVVKHPIGCILFPKDARGITRNSIAWNIGMSGCDYVRGGLVFDRGNDLNMVATPSGARQDVPSVDPRTGRPQVPGSQSSFPTNTFPNLGGYGLKRAPIPAGGQYGSYLLNYRYPTPPAPAAGGSSITPGIIGVASFNAGSGIIDVGGSSDKHQIGRDEDGHPINSTHLPLGVYFRSDDAIDGPLNFDGGWEGGDVADRRMLVHFEWDGSSSHPFVCGSRAGVYRWHSYCQIYSPTPGIPILPPPTPPFTPPPPSPPGIPITPDIPITPGIPTEGIPTPTLATIKGGQRSILSWDDDFGEPTGSKGGNSRGGGGFGSGEGRGGAGGGGESPQGPNIDYLRSWQRGSRSLYYNASMKEFSAPAFIGRPQCSPSNGKALNFKNSKSGSLGERFFNMFDSETPVVMRVEAYGQQVGTACNWSYTERPSRSKYGGGTASGGFVMFPPEIGVEDRVNSYAPPNRTLSTSYFVAGPNTYFGAGAPDFANGSVDTGWAWGRVTTSDATADTASLLAANDLGGWMFPDRTPSFAIRRSNGGFAWRSGQGFWGTFIHANTANRTYTLPDSTGTLLTSAGANPNRVAFYDGTSTLTTSANLTFDGTVLTALQYQRVGTTTGAASPTQGDFAAGLTGAAQIIFDQSAGTLTLTDSTGATSTQFGSAAAGTTTFNAGALNHDLVIAGAPIAQLFMTDASEDRVYVGRSTEAPVDTLPWLIVGNASQERAGIRVQSSSGTPNYLDCFWGGVSRFAISANNTVTRFISATSNVLNLSQNQLDVTTASGSTFARFATTGGVFSVHLGGGTLTSQISGVALTSTVFNETGLDIDFRIESDTLTSAFAMDATDGQILMQGYSRIGTATDAAAQGDLSTGLTSSSRWFYDQSVPSEAQILANGQELRTASVTELTTIAAAATTDTAIQIPVDAIAFAVSVRVTVAIPTAATFTVTGTTSGTQFDVASGVSVAVNTTDVGTRNCPFKNGAAQTIRITPNLVPATNAGRVRTTIWYIQSVAPTS